MSERPRIYIESDPLIDLVKIKVGATPKDGAETEVFFVEQAIEAARAGDVELYTSVLSVAECTNVGDPSKLEAAKPFYLGLLASGKSGFRLIQTTLSIVERSRDLRWVNGANLRGADAVHVASAVHLDCDELWSGDGRVLDSGAVLHPLGIRICKPSQTQSLPKKYFQGKLKL